jgi:uncharacterized protein (DUF1800 family)
MSQDSTLDFTRRDILNTAAALGAGLALGSLMETLPATALAPSPAGDPPPANDALIPLIALSRMCFGPRPGDATTSFDAFAALPGVDNTERLYAFIDQQLDPLNIPDTDCDTRIANASLATLGKTLMQLWQQHNLNNPTSSVRNQPAREARTAAMLRAVYSRRQLYEVLVEFWHNHFNVHAFDTYTAPVFMSYDRDVMRGTRVVSSITYPNVLGNFRYLLEQVARSTAMLYYLDNYINQDGGPNENYARELFELHTLGAENYLGVMLQQDVPGYPSAPIGYVDNDVYEATRCLTGWRVNNGSSGAPGNDGNFLYYDAWHDRFQKTVLGFFINANQAPQYDGLKVLDLVAAHPGTARFICRKLCRRLIGDNPPDALVNSAADVFVTQAAAPDQLKQVVRHILRSTEFRTTWGEKIKRPNESVISMLRATRAEYLPHGPTELTTTNPIWSRYDAIGQPMFGRRPPDGYPDVKEAWTNSTSMLYRWRFCQDLMEGNIRLTGNPPPPNTLSTTANVNSQMVGPTTPSEIVDFWVNRLLGPGYPLASATRTELLKFISGSYPNAPNDNPLSAQQLTDRLKRLVALILMSPDCQWR